jgi:hypothetical protein
MLRVGYPATISAELLRDFPPGIELIPLPDNLDHDILIPRGPCASGRGCAVCV